MQISSQKHYYPHAYTSFCLQVRYLPTNKQTHEATKPTNKTTEGNISSHLDRLVTLSNHVHKFIVYSYQAICVRFQSVSNKLLSSVNSVNCRIFEIEKICPNLETFLENRVDNHVPECSHQHQRADERHGNTPQGNRNYWWSETKLEDPQVSLG